VVIDTNLLIRYLVNDDSRKVQIVESLLEKAVKGEVNILVPSIVIAELVWVLESFYRMQPAEISDFADSILNTPGIFVSDEQVVRSAISRYRSGGAGFIDAWIAEFAIKEAADEIIAFDKKHFRGIEVPLVTQL
jgi:predicted nucleic-acid-binding protein